MSYIRMEYREPDERVASSQHGVGASQQTVTEPAPDPAKMFAERLEEEKRTIAAQMRAESEREIQHTRASIVQAIDAFTKQSDEYFRQVEGEVVQLALAIARRIMHRESQIDPQLLAALVRHELDQLDTATSVRLVVSPDALAYWNEAASSMPRKVEVIADRTVASGTLRMETALGSTSIDFEHELKEIECGFFDLLSHRPSSEDSRAARVQ
jgi:flagellar assembly protein FliH